MTEPKIEYKLIDNDRDAAYAMGSLCEYDALGLDLEMADWRRGERHERLSTLQVSGLSRDGSVLVWIFDLFSVKIETIKDLLEAPDTLFAIHNGRDYDMRKLRLHCKLELRNVWDTLVAERHRRGRKGNSLDQVAERHLGWKMDKTEQQADWGVRPLTPSLLRYAARDAAAHLMIYYAQREAGYQGGEVTKMTAYEGGDSLLPGLEEVADFPKKLHWLKEFIDSGAANRYQKEWCTRENPIIHLLPGDTAPYAKHLLGWLELIIKRRYQLLPGSPDEDGCGWRPFDGLCLSALNDLIDLVERDIQPNPAALENARRIAYEERKKCYAGYDQYIFEKAVRYHERGHFPPLPKLSIEEINKQSWIDLSKDLLKDYRKMASRLIGMRGTV